MTPPTLKQLIERATPGTWWAKQDNEDRPPVHSDYRVLSAGSTPDRVAPIARMELRGQASEANAQLIARCNPATMAKVVEALELSASRFAYTNTMKDEVTIAQKVIDALNLLNGKPTP